MYREYFGLQRKPFNKTPDPSFLYLSRSHEEALERMKYCVEEREIMVLTGEVGCGKTTLTRALVDSLDESYRIIIILNPRLTPTQFLRIVAKQFGIEPDVESKDDLLYSIHERIYKDYESGITPLVIIDEAQLIPWRETFEEIRLLTNYQLDDSNLLSLMLVGQPELKEKLNLKVLRPLRQRVGILYHIPALNRDEAKEYVKHRLGVAGRHAQLFTESALERLYSYSEGLPRLINSLANISLLEGLGDGMDFIDEPQVEAASRELGLHSHRSN